MVDIIHRVGIKAPPAKVYAAVATVEGVAGWWTRDTTGVSKVGGTITFRFQSPGGDEIGKFDVEVQTSCSASGSSSRPGRAGKGRTS